MGAPRSAEQAIRGAARKAPGMKYAQITFALIAGIVIGFWPLSGLHDDEPSPSAGCIAARYDIDRRAWIGIFDTMDKPDRSGERAAFREKLFRYYDRNCR